MGNLTPVPQFGEIAFGNLTDAFDGYSYLAHVSLELGNHPWEP